MKIYRVLMGLMWLLGVTSASHATSQPSRLEVKLIKAQADDKDAQGTDETVLTAADFAGAELAREPKGQIGVSVRLTRAGTAKLRAVSTANVGKRLAIMLDGAVVAAPLMHHPITHGTMLITLKNDETAADLLLSALSRPS